MAHRDDGRRRSGAGGLFPHAVYDSKAKDNRIPPTLPPMVGSVRGRMQLIASTNGQPVYAVWPTH